MKENLERWHARLAAICGDLSLSIVRRRIGKGNLQDWSGALVEVAEEMKNENSSNRHGNDRPDDRGPGVRIGNSATNSISNKDLGARSPGYVLHEPYQTDLFYDSRCEINAPHNRRRTSEKTNDTSDDGRRNVAVSRQHRRGSGTLPSVRQKDVDSVRGTGKLVSEKRNLHVEVCDALVARTINTQEPDTKVRIRIKRANSGRNVTASSATRRASDSDTVAKNAGTKKPRRTGTADKGKTVATKSKFRKKHGKTLG